MPLQVYIMIVVDDEDPRPRFKEETRNGSRYAIPILKHIPHGRLLSVTGWAPPTQFNLWLYGRG